MRGSVCTRRFGYTKTKAEGAERNRAHAKDARHLNFNDAFWSNTAVCPDTNSQQEKKKN